LYIWVTIIVLNFYDKEIHDMLYLDNQIIPILFIKMT